MCRGNANARRQSGLNKDLLNSFQARCALLREDALPADSGSRGSRFQKPFHPSQCHELGICVCSEFPDCLHMLANLQSHLRKTCRKKKKQSPPARQLLDQRVLFLEFTCATQVALPGPDRAQDTDPDMDEWDMLLQEDETTPMSAQEGSLPSKVYVHVGFVNRSNWRFSGFRCVEVAPDAWTGAAWPSGLVHLAHMSEELAGEQLATFTSAELMAHVLSSKEDWRVSFRAISLNPDHWTLFYDASVPTLPVDEVPEMVFWQGSDNERRARMSRKRPGHGRSRGSAAPRPRAKQRAGQARRAAGRGRNRGALADAGAPDPDPEALDSAGEDESQSNSDEAPEEDCEDEAQESEDMAVDDPEPCKSSSKLNRFVSCVFSAVSVSASDGLNSIL